jgi:membrane-associated phospholipid phosphatase
MKKAVLLLCFITTAFHGFAQDSAFTYDIKKDVLIGALSIGVFVTPFFVHNEPETSPGILSKNDVNAFDRGLMFSYNKPLDLVSDIGVYGMLALPALSVIGNIGDKNTLLTYGIMYTEAVFLTFGTKDLLKNAVIRYRPYVYADGIPSGKGDDYYNSFPSGSTALAFLSAGFLSATFSAEYPDSKWKIPIIGGAYTLAGGVALSRILSGSHFLSDVLTGAAIGSVYGWLLPVLHKKQRNNNAVALNISGNGIAVSLRF